jgi:hypothetical protein
MSRGAQKFTQGDVTKACKGAVKAGLKVQRAEVRIDGSIVLDFSGPPIASGTEADVNEWDTIK